MQNTPLFKQVLRPGYRYTITSKVYKVVTESQKEKAFIIDISKKKNKPIPIKCTILNDKGKCTSLYPLENVALNGINTIWHYCTEEKKQPVFTAIQLIEIITGERISNPQNNIKVIEELNETLKRISEYTLILNASEQYTNWKATELNKTPYNFKSEMNTNLVSIDQIQLINKKGTLEQGYIITEKPPFMIYAEWCNHYMTSFATVPKTKEKSKKLKYDGTNLALKDYIINELANIKHQDSNRKTTPTHRIKVKKAYRYIYRERIKPYRKENKAEYIQQLKRQQRLKQHIQIILQDVQNAGEILITDIDNLEYKALYK